MPKLCRSSSVGIFLLLTGAVASSAQTAPYRPVVADARSRQALPAATVLADGQPRRPDDAGRLNLPQAPARLTISHVGYQPRQWQPAPALDTLWLLPQTVALPDVRIRAQPNLAEWRYAGKARWPHDFFAGSLTPGMQVAVFYRPTDSTRHYRIRAVRVRLGQRAANSFGEAFAERRHFVAGRLRVRLALPTADGSPSSLALAPEWVITPAESGQHQDGWLRLPLPAEVELAVPATGIFVVAGSLTDSDAETVTRTRLLRYQRKNPEKAAELDPKQGGKGSAFVEVQSADAAPARLVNLHDYPAVAHRTVVGPAASRSWLVAFKRWQSQTAYHAEMQRRMPANDYLNFNYELTLEVEER